MRLQRRALSVCVCVKLRRRAFFSNCVCEVTKKGSFYVCVCVEKGSFSMCV